VVKLSIKLNKHSRILLLVGWLLGILLPMHAFRRFSSTYRAAFDFVFHTHVSHVLMHTFLYAVLAYLLCSQLGSPSRSRGRTALFVIAIVAVVAVLQESIQMAAGHIRFGFDEIFDVLVDLNGGMLSAMGWLWISGNKAKTE